MFIFKAVIAVMADVTPSKELALKIWTAMCLVSSMIMVAWAIKSKLLMKKAQDEAWHMPMYSKAQSTFRSRDDYTGKQISNRNRSGNKYSLNRGQGKKKKPGSVPRWINLAFSCVDAFLKAVDHGASWFFGRKATAKKVSSKSIRHKAKLSKRLAKKGRHFKRYWGCTKEAKFKARQAAIAANRHWTTSYWQLKARENQARVYAETAARDAEEDEAFWNAMPSYEDNFSFMPGLVPKRSRCVCHGCERVDRTVVYQSQARPQQLSYAKAPASVIVPSRRTFFNAHVLLFLIGIAFGMLCVPATVMDLGDGSKSLIGKLPLFTGKRDDFIMWLAKFTALATMGAFAAAIAQNGDGSFGEKNCPKDQQEVDDITKDIADNPLSDTASARERAKRAADKEKLEIWKCNAKAFAAITLTMPNKLYRILAASNGLAHVAMQQLYHEYKPDNHMSRVEAERKYSSIWLNDNGNPRYLSQCFAEIAHQHPSAAADEPKKIAIILAAAPRMYQSILASQQLVLGAQCTAENLIQAMGVVYRQHGGGIHGGRNNNNNNNHELAMEAPGNRTKKCWNCNKAGHVSKDCRSPSTNNKYKPGNNNNNNNNGSSNTRSQRDVVCDECGMRGHKRDRCFCLAANAHRRPANWRPPAGYRGGNSGAGDEQGQASLDHGGDDCNGYELMMCQLTFAQHKEFFMIQTFGLVIPVLRLVPTWHGQHD
jgi:Zinc knuckle